MCYAEINLILLPFLRTAAAPRPDQKRGRTRQLIWGIFHPRLRCVSRFVAVSGRRQSSGLPTISRPCCLGLGKAVAMLGCVSQSCTWLLCSGFAWAPRRHWQAGAGLFGRKGSFGRSMWRLPDSRAAQAWTKCTLVCIYALMNSRDIIAKLIGDGWSKVGQKGDHVQFKHSTKPGRVTVPHPARDIPIGTLKSIEKQAGLKMR